VELIMAASPSVRCETPEELFEVLVQDVLHATCTPLEKTLAAKRLVAFTVHPEQHVVLEGYEPDIPPPDPEEPPPERTGLARRFGL
jgi:hypothetical protein